MGLPYRKTRLAGWGRYAPAECAVYRPEQQRMLRAVVADREFSTIIARGLGRSYGDVAVNGGAGVVDCTRLNRLLGFDAERGVVDCEGGVSLEELLEVFVPRGWFLPVTPGTKFVTVGGAIANDVHGKNHHRDGTFSQFVEEIELLTGTGEVLRCGPQNNPEIFWATAGGLGLTGIILRARLRLQPITSAYIRVDYKKLRNLDESIAEMAAHDAEYQYSVSWIDCLARGATLGRGVLMRGNHIAREALTGPQRDAPLSIPKARAKSVPFDVPGFVLNRLSIAAFNEVFYRMHATREGVVTDYDTYFYPLDAIHNWNRLYSTAGFVQYQATLPYESQPGLVKVLERLSRSGRASFLAVLKCFGPANPGLLSHPIPGYTLTLDIPNRRGLVPFLHELDAILLDHGGRVYFGKDSVVKAESVAKMYPRLAEFKEICARLDPQQRFSSNLARRTGLLV